MYNYKTKVNKKGIRPSELWGCLGSHVCQIHQSVVAKHGRQSTHSCWALLSVVCPVI